MVRSLRNAILSGLFLTLGCGTLLAQEYDTGSFRSVIGSGGMVEQVSSKGSYVVSGVMGQLLIEDRTSNAYVVKQGFWVDPSTRSGVENKDVTLNNNLTNSPNPFSSTTTIKYELPGSAFVTLKVYDAVGNLVKTVFEGYQNSGEQAVAFDGTDNTNTTLSSGSYMYELNVRPASMAGESFQAYVTRNIMVLVR